MKDNIKENFVQLRPLFNKFILSACKCRKKLAHLSCFNNYIYMNQSGNINNQMTCQHCNLKYEFSYPYNGLVLRTFDYIDQFLNVSGTMATVGFLIAGAYWCAMSYGVLSILQIYGKDEGAAIVRNTSILVSATLLPCIPIILISSRFIRWEKTVEKCFPSCFQYKSSVYNKKSQHEVDERYDNNEEDELENCRLLKKFRLVVGGLALPSLAVAVDKLILRNLTGSDQSPSIVRTTMIGLAFVTVKGFAKMIYRQQKSMDEENKSIQDYKT